jgi:hypothetical protein
MLVSVINLIIVAKCGCQYVLRFLNDLAIVNVIFTYYLIGCKSVFIAVFVLS